MAIFHKKVWVYWLVIVASILVLLRTLIHAVAETQRFVDGQSDRYFRFVTTLLFIPLAACILRSLLKHESREYMRTPLVYPPETVVPDQNPADAATTKE